MESAPGETNVFAPSGRVAVITGAAGGIGLGIARAFLGAGMRVVVSDLDGDRVEAAAAGLRSGGGEAIAVAADVSRRAEVEALAEAAMDSFGRVDVLCNNAGVSTFNLLRDQTLQDWR